MSRTRVSPQLLHPGSVIQVAFQKFTTMVQSTCPGEYTPFLNTKGMIVHTMAPFTPRLATSNLIVESASDNSYTYGGPIYATVWYGIFRDSESPAGFCSASMPHGGSYGHRMKVQGIYVSGSTTPTIFTTRAMGEVATAPNGLRFGRVYPSHYAATTGGWMRITEVSV
jgi:hypothetical protein